MKVKLPFFIILIFLIIVSMFQIFPLPPFADQLYPVYESGYFMEIRQNQEIVRDAFLEIKIHGRSEAAWLFLKNLENAHGIEGKVYNRRGQLVTAPGEKEQDVESDVSAYLKKNSGAVVSSISMNRFSSFLPLKADKRCGFCHKKAKIGEIIGVLHLNHPFDAHIYYTGERVFIFLLIICVLGGLLFLLLKWEPEGKIKEMFDKS